MMWRWYNDPEYRQRQLARWGIDYPEVVVAAPYTGHRWLDMARKAVLGSKNLDDSQHWADDYHDEMGEAVLALLEGRDMGEAVSAYRKQEYVPRRLTIRYDDWRDDEDAGSWFDRVMPTVPSAEDQYLDSKVYTETRFNDVSTRRRNMRHKTSQPSNRRSNRR
jgi:hypothetical protein